MKRIMLALAFTNVLAFASVPEPVITHMSSVNSHATIAGRLNAKPEGPIGISVQNGGILYSTISDAEGRWAIVIRHRAVNVQVTSWSLSDPRDKIAIKAQLVK